MKTLTVEVTQHDIDMGHQCSSGYCPIANALDRVAVPAGCFFTVGTRSASLKRLDRDGPLTLEDAMLPKHAREFVTEFDRYKSGTPFTFEITFERL